MTLRSFAIEVPRGPVWLRGGPGEILIEWLSRDNWNYFFETRHKDSLLGLDKDYLFRHIQAEFHSHNDLTLILSVSMDHDVLLHIDYGRSGQFGGTYAERNFRLSFDLWSLFFDDWVNSYQKENWSLVGF